MHANDLCKCVLTVCVSITFECAYMAIIYKLTMLDVTNDNSNIKIILIYVYIYWYEANIYMCIHICIYIYVSK